METSDTTTTTTKITFFHHSSSSSPSSCPNSSSTPPLTPSPPPRLIVPSPCAACKILHRRCVDKCVLAPYFPPTEPLTFTIAHRVFGASNIIKILQAQLLALVVTAGDYLLGIDLTTVGDRCSSDADISFTSQELPENQRADAVSSMVYEANARIRDPVYGSAGVICQLQKQVSELRAQLVRAKSELVNIRTQHANLLALMCMDMAQSQQHYMPQQFDNPAGSLNIFEGDSCFLDASMQGSLWEPPWT